MAKKTFVRARLVKGKRWHIDYILADPLTGIEQRHRKDFELNLIADLATREAVGLRLIKYLDYFISLSTENRSQAEFLALEDALALALDIKLLSPRKNTHKGYLSISKAFTTWIRARSLHRMDVTQFSRKHCRFYFDNLLSLRAYRPSTINNHLTHLKALWSELYERELVAANPWKHIKPVKQVEKIRREFTPEESKIVAAAVKERDVWMYKALLLQYFCYIRPTELPQLRFRDFDFNSMVIRIDSGRSKNKKPMVKTIPECIYHEFRNGEFENYPGNYFVFGFNGSNLHPSENPINSNRMYKKHRKILLQLKASGKLHSIEGLTWYSWKDTGVTRHIKKVHPVSTRDQADHTELKTTLRYYHKSPVNSDYQKLPFDLE